MKKQPGGIPEGCFRVVTYNIHKCRGMDGSVQPERIVRVLREIGADIVALQEVWSAIGGKPQDHQGSYIAGELGLKLCLGEVRRIKAGGYGNTLLTRFPVLDAHNYDITHAGRERRGCLRVDLDIKGQLLHAFNVHLGTAFVERRHQGRRLVGPAILNSDKLEGLRVLLGDFNEWTRGLASRLLSDHLSSLDIREHLGRSRTYPGWLPLLHLDHIYYDPRLKIEGMVLHRSRTALMASDHLPLVADFRLRETSDG